MNSEEVPASKRCKLMEPEKPTTSAKYILKTFPKTISKTNDRDVPLPSPFPLPQNYRADVAAALEAGQMTTDTEKAFFSSIASAIFKYKKMPTTEDYIDVATSIIKKYPFFKATSLSGKSYVSKIIILIVCIPNSKYLYSHIE